MTELNKIEENDEPKTAKPIKRKAGRKLSPQKVSWVREYLACGNATDAYAKVYDCTGMTRNQISHAAADLAASKAVKALIQKVSEKTVRRTVDDLMRDLRYVFDLALAKKDLKTAVACIAQEAKLLGLDKVVHDHNINGGGTLIVKVVRKDANGNIIEDKSAEGIILEGQCEPA